ncbi:nuclear transport factor 2 family protein [Spongiimicrobium salis]|uniref:nuclear transport factor 2 family protein n=1 Tax=Spongiimicrobium salis TaxID=1667022 RepID=UPI00374D57E6
MKRGIVIVLFFFFGCQENTKNNKVMEEQQQIQEVVTSVFIHTDNGHWSAVEALFDAQVDLDYSSMTGNPAVSLSPQAITTAWKTVLPGFLHTHHQIGNFVIKVVEDKAHAFIYGTATHYLEDDAGSLWTVVGTYDFDLEKRMGDWKINKMKFNYKYQTGNPELVKRAITNVKK